MLEEEFEKNIVEAIQIGLRNGKYAKDESGDLFDNYEKFRKIDKVMDALYNKFLESEIYQPFFFFRGSHKLLLAYNKENHNLLSFMSRNRLNNLVNSNKLENRKNYIFALMKFNPDKRIQTTLFDDVEWISDEHQKVIQQVKQIISEDGEINYITILYDIQKYTLTGVKEVRLSQYAETIEQKDLSDYITVNYSDIYENEVIDRDISANDVEFGFKDGIITEKLNLDIKVEKKKKEGIDNE